MELGMGSFFHQLTPAKSEQHKTMYRWVTLYPNTFNLKLEFI